jgi:hypothetical protein
MGRSSRIRCALNRDKLVTLADSNQNSSVKIREFQHRVTGVCGHSIGYNVDRIAADKT